MNGGTAFPEVAGTSCPGATGWVGTDWVEDLLLTAEGPDVYDQWIDHDVLFVDPCVEMAFERFQQIMETPGYVFARPFVLDVSLWDSAEPLGVSDGLMHNQGSFFAVAIQAFGFDLDDFATFEFPPVGACSAAADVSDDVRRRSPTWRRERGSRPSIRRTR